MVLQKLLPEGATVVLMIIVSDKTKLSVFSSDKQVWPVYLTTGNALKELCQQASQGATVLLGYLPVLKLECFSEAARALQGQQLYHDCMAVIFELTIAPGTNGIPILCSDGWNCLAFPILVADVADYPEQCLVACCKQNQCPTCLVDLNKQGNNITSPQ
jgi:hypothetical protein